MTRIIETCPKCGHDLVDLVLTTYPPIPQKKCFNCGWEWTGENEEIVRIPFDETDYNRRCYHYVERYVPVQPSDVGYDTSPCVHCSNNPKNGGSGICHCILGQQAIC